MALKPVGGKRLEAALVAATISGALTLLGQALVRVEFRWVKDESPANTIASIHYRNPVGAVWKATPHDGRVESFFNDLRLLAPFGLGRIDAPEDLPIPEVVFIEG